MHVKLCCLLMFSERLSLFHHDSDGTKRSTEAMLYRTGRKLEKGRKEPRTPHVVFLRSSMFEHLNKYLAQLKSEESNIEAAAHQNEIREVVDRV